MSDIVEVATFGTAFEARAAKAHLESEGIRASVVTDTAGGTIPSMSLLSTGVRLLVTKEDLERAEAILSEMHDEAEVVAAEEAEEAEELAEEGLNA